MWQSRPAPVIAPIATRSGSLIRSSRAPCTRACTRRARAVARARGAAAQPSTQIRRRSRCTCCTASRPPIPRPCRAAARRLPSERPWRARDAAVFLRRALAEPATDVASSPTSRELGLALAAYVQPDAATSCPPPSTPPPRHAAQRARAARCPRTRPRRCCRARRSISAGTASRQPAAIPGDARPPGGRIRHLRLGRRDHRRRIARPRHPSRSPTSRPLAGQRRPGRHPRRRPAEVVAMLRPLLASRPSPASPIRCWTRPRCSS